MVKPRIYPKVNPENIEPAQTATKHEPKQEFVAASEPQPQPQPQPKEATLLLPDAPEMDLLGKVMIFSEDCDLEPLANKMHLIIDHSPRDDGFITLCLNNPILATPYFGKHLQSQGLSCDPRGKLIPLSDGGDNVHKPALFFVTDRGTMSPGPYLNADFLSDGRSGVIVMSSSYAFGRAKDGGFDPKSTIVVDGFNFFSNEDISFNIRHPDQCRITDGIPDIVFSRKPAHDMFAEIKEETSYTAPEMLN